MVCEFNLKGFGIKLIYFKIRLRSKANFILILIQIWRILPLKGNLLGFLIDVVGFEGSFSKVQFIAFEILVFNFLLIDGLRILMSCIYRCFNFGFV